MLADITVYIPVYNGAQFIGRAIESVLGQTFHSLSLVIADNFSTDGTVSVVEKYMSDPRIVLIRRPENIGALRNFNDGISLIDTKYFMLLCHDDYLFSDLALQNAYQILEENPEVPVVYADMMFVDQNDKPIVRKRFGYNGLVKNMQVAKRSIITGRNYYSIPLLSRTVALGGLRYEASLPFTSDVDFAINFGKDLEIYYLQDVLLAIRFHKSNNTARTFNTLEHEFTQLATKHNIGLSGYELILKRFNNFLVAMQKRIFFLYLDIFRR